MIASYEEVLGCRISRHRSAPGASGRCQCVVHAVLTVHAVLGASVLSHCGERIQIRSARAGLGALCVADLGDS